MKLATRGRYYKINGSAMDAVNSKRACAPPSTSRRNKYFHRFLLRLNARVTAAYRRYGSWVVVIDVDGNARLNSNRDSFSGTRIFGFVRAESRFPVPRRKRQEWWIRSIRSDRKPRYSLINSILLPSTLTARR